MKIKPLPLHRRVAQLHDADGEHDLARLRRMSDGQLLALAIWLQDSPGFPRAYQRATGRSWPSRPEAS